MNLYTLQKQELFVPLSVLNIKLFKSYFGLNRSREVFYLN